MRGSNINIETLECRRLLSFDTLGPEVLLPGDTHAVPSAGNQEHAAIATGEDQNGNPVSLAVWTDYRTAIHEPSSFGNLFFDTQLGRLTDIYAARIDADGNVIDTTPIVVDQSEFYQGLPQVGWNGTHWLVSYESDRTGDRSRNDVRAVRIAADGTVVDSTPITIQQAPTSLDRYFPLSVSSNGDQFVVAYTSYAGSNTKQVRAVRIANDGTILNPGGQLLHSATTTWEPHGDLEYLPTGNPGGQYLFAYQNGIVGYVQRLDAQLNPLGGAISVTGGEGLSPQIASNGVDQWFVTASQEINQYRPIYGRTVAPDGTMGSSVLVDEDGPAAVGFDGTNYVVSFTNWVFGQGWQTHYRKVSPSGTLQPRESINGLAGEEVFPQLARVGDSVQAVYQHYGIEGQSLVSGRYIAGIMLHDDGTKGPESTVSLAAPRQSQIDLADNGNGFLAVWRDDSDLGFKVMAQRLDATGAAIDPQPVELGDVDPTRQLGPVRGHELPSVAFNGNLYLVTWSLGNQIYARRVGLDGQPIDAAPFVVMPGDYPDVAALGSTFLIAGTYEVINHLRPTYVTRVDGAGNVLDTPLQIGVGQWNEDPSVAAVGNRWLVAWERNNTHDNEFSVIRAALVNANFSATGEFVVGSSGDVPVIAYDGTNALIVWRAGAEANPSDIMGRIIDPATGGFVTGEFVISNAHETQSMPNVAFDGTNYIVTWIDQRNYGFPNQDRDDVYAARVSPSGVVLDPDGVAIASSELPETAPTVGVSSAGPVFAYSKLVNDAPYGTMRLVTRGPGVDTIAPTAVETGFLFQSEQAVEIRFSEDVAASLALEDLQVQNLTTSQPLVPVSMTYDATTWTAKFAFAAPIEDGNYRATLPAGSVSDAAGNALASDVEIDFFFLNGDANRDGQVNLADFNILAANFGQSPREFTQGDFNYDSVVNLADFNLLAARFGTTLGAGDRVGLSSSKGESTERDDWLRELLA